MPYCFGFNILFMKQCIWKQSVHYILNQNLLDSLSSFLFNDRESVCSCFVFVVFLTKLRKITFLLFVFPDGCI